MSWMFESVNFFVLCCLLVSTEAITVLPPEDVSVLWVDDFRPGLSWAPPQHLVSNHCTYDVSTNTGPETGFFYRNVSSPWNDPRIMNGGFLELSIKTVCNGTKSEPVVVNVSYPEVKNFECYSSSSQHAYCSWSSPSPIQDLRFFYWASDEVYKLQECKNYTNTDGVRTGCDLQVATGQFYNILFNGTLNNTLIRNTFSIELSEKVRPPGLQWTVTKDADKFNISWIAPDIFSRHVWNFSIKYTVCDENKEQIIKGIAPHHMTLDIDPNCAYRIAIQGQSNKGNTPWSEEKYFEADNDPNAFVYAAVVIPLVIASLAALVLVCCRKNKEQIFPKVPAPLDLLSDISDNNNKSALYVPTEEEENCNISLVIEPQTNKSF